VNGNHTLKHICGGCLKLDKGEDSSHPAKNCFEGPVFCIEESPWHQLFLDPYASLQHQLINFNHFIRMILTLGRSTVNHIRLCFRSLVFNQLYMEKNMGLHSCIILVNHISLLYRGSWFNLSSLHLSDNWCNQLNQNNVVLRLNLEFVLPNSADSPTYPTMSSRSQYSSRLMGLQSPATVSSLPMPQL
jgi:hypothetical protein